MAYLKLPISRVGLNFTKLPKVGLLRLQTVQF